MISKEVSSVDFDFLGNAFLNCYQGEGSSGERTNQKYVVYKAVKFRDQLVAGLKLNIKVFAGEEDYIHLSVFQQLPCKGGNVELLNVEVGKTKYDPIGPFPYC
ncbi:hypothetical protein JOQ06_017913 [Pogonophryne albipinna]|uniref:Cystatin domain-containing protein n=1 Tax=Pogonophryne albipinna TaxID=1090488 RepID=A0AAD6AI90_9TELE|nr:hypothetical protein JOQ06_017913 [Pogonophryne albipinna]